MILRQILESRAIKVDGVSISTQSPPAWLVSLFGLGAETTSGVDVSEPVAKGFSLFAAALDAITRPLSTVPLVVYKRLDRGREKAEKHWLYPLLRTSPNPDMSSIDWRERAIGDMLLGNSYNAISFDNRGTVARIDPLPPELILPRVTTDGRVIYERTDVAKVYQPAEMLHFKGPGTGVVGASTIRRHAQALGGMIAADRFAGSYFGNGATLSGVLQHPAQLSKDAQERLREQWQKLYGNRGGQGSNKVAVLEEAMKFEPISSNPEESQLLETRKDNVRQMARMFGIPPHRLQDLEDAHFDNIESQNVDFWQALLYFAEKIEQEIDRKLLYGSPYYCKHDLRTMLRADTEKRGAFYAQGRQWGFFSQNDIRELEDMNPIEGGDKYLSPMNMIPADQLEEYVASLIEAKMAPKTDPSQQQAPPVTEGNAAAAPTVAEVRERAREAFLPLFREAAERIVRREIGEVQKAARRMLFKAEYGAWLDEFFLHQQEQSARILGPHLLAYAAMCDATVAEGDVLALAKRVCEVGRLSAGKAAGDAKAFENLMTTWDQDRAEAIAQACAGVIQ